MALLGIVLLVNHKDKMDNKGILLDKVLNKVKEIINRVDSKVKDKMDNKGILLDKVLNKIKEIINRVDSKVVQSLVLQVLKEAVAKVYSLDENSKVILVDQILNKVKEILRVGKAVLLEVMV